jgi:hypothetical protein
MQSEHLSILTSFNKIPCRLKEELKSYGSPFHSPAFFYHLEGSDSVSQQHGWQPYHLVSSYHGKEYFLPGYLKQHSYGEYIFDWSLADALIQAGYHYYPKWVMQYPFTPIEMKNCLPEEAIPSFVENSREYFRSLNLLTAQYLYLPETWISLFRQSGALIRQSIFFNWKNLGYRDWQDYSTRLSAKRAKECRRERRKIAQLGYEIERLSGNAINEQVIKDFYQFYQKTYLLRSGHTGYLNYVFFHRWLLACKEQALLVTARRGKKLVAGALFLFDDTTLYGRYWGSHDRNNGLHFECCFYQGMEFCIENNLKYFNPGVQGEHKVRRGFEPYLVSSAYYYFMPSIVEPIATYFKQEQQQLMRYLNYLEGILPFKPPIA